MLFSPPLLLLAFALSGAVPPSELCQSPKPLGMESGAIQDRQLSSSSSFAHSLGPNNARIRSEREGGAWCPREQVAADSYEFVQVDLDSLFEVVAIEVQGRHANGTGREWTEQLMVDYRAHEGPWTRHQTQGEQLLSANNDERTAVLIALRPPLSASSLRLVPFSVQLRTVCLRFELYGCPKEGESVQHWTDALLRRPGAILLPLLLLVFLALLFSAVLLLRRYSRANSSSDRKGIFPSSSAPLRPSSSWQNVLLPFECSSPAKVFSPSFCRFESVSLGWPTQKRQSTADGRHLTPKWVEGGMPKLVPRSNSLAVSHHHNQGNLAHSNSHPDSLRRPPANRKPMPKPRSYIPATAN